MHEDLTISVISGPNVPCSFLAGPLLLPDTSHCQESLPVRACERFIIVATLPQHMPALASFRPQASPRSLESSFWKKPWNQNLQLTFNPRTMLLQRLLGQVTALALV